jgi:hypothetical protein
MKRNRMHCIKVSKYSYYVADCKLEERDSILSKCKDVPFVTMSRTVLDAANVLSNEARFKEYTVIKLITFFPHFDHRLSDKLTHFFQQHTLHTVKQNSHILNGE